MGSLRPDPRAERLDARLRDLPAASLHPFLDAIAEIDRFAGWWSARFAHAPPFLSELRARTLEAAAAASAQIDWTGLPRSAARGHAGRPGAEAARAKRYREALAAILDGYRDMALGRKLFASLHAAVTGRPEPSPYRAAPDPAVFFPGPVPGSAVVRSAEPDRIAAAVDSLAAWTDDRLARRAFHPLLIAGSFVLEFLSIRPFPGGNERLSRLLSHLLLLRGGYAFVAYAPLDRAVAERKAEYFLALRRAQAGLASPRPDVSAWLCAYLEPVRAAARQLRAALAPLPPPACLSANQEAVLRLFQRHEAVTVRLACRELGLRRDTAKQVLGRLLALGAVTRFGAGRAACYRPASEGAR